MYIYIYYNIYEYTLTVTLHNSVVHASLAKK